MLEMPKRIREEYDYGSGDDPLIGSRKAVRTPQACCNCRRRKSKCDGSRPSCRNCNRLQDKCTWPNSPAPFEILEQSGPKLSLDGDLGNFLPVVSTNGFPKPAMVQRLLELFYRLHHDVEFCSFLHRHTFDLQQPQSPFLITSIIALSALYVPDVEAQQEFGFETSAALSNHYLLKAREFSRDLCQAPCVLNMQSNLILALCEHVSWNETRGFMTTGLAIRMALTMRLGRDYNQSHTIREQEIRRRTFWSCFIMDRFLAFCGGRMQAINVRYVDVQLPCPESTFAFEDNYIGPKVMDLLAASPETHHNDVLPYFITSMYLWGQMEEIWLLVGREGTIQPTDSTNDFPKANMALENWTTGLPKRMQWSENNYKLHKGLGQGKVFVTMHLLLHHAKALGHYEYLPQLDDLPLHSINSTGIPMYQQQDQLISSCLSNVRAITEIASLLYHGTDQDRENLQSPMAANALVIACSVQLWTHYVGNLRSDLTSGNYLAKTHFDLLVEILASWRRAWKVEKAWNESLDMIVNLYNSAYGGEVVLETIIDGVEVPKEDGPDQNSVETLHQASIGNGIQDPATVRQKLHEKIRLAMAMAMVSSENKEKLKRVFLGTLWQHMSSMDAFLSVSPPDMFAGFGTTSVTFNDFMN